MEIYALCLVAFCTIAALRTVWLVIYRLVFHPLAKFPGPRIAAATGWYEAYFDLIKHPGGQFIYEINRMHDEYGPIVRINPEELHVKDSSWEEVLYTGYSQGVRDKYPPSALMAGSPNDVFGTVPHNLHRMRRRAINSLFSRSAFQNIEPILWRHLNQFCDLVQRQIQDKGSAEMAPIYLALVGDVLIEYEISQDLGLLKDAEKAQDWHKTTLAMANLAPCIRMFPWIAASAMKLPLRVVRALSPDLTLILDVRQFMHERAHEAVQRASSDPSSLKPSSKNVSSKTVWDGILNSNLTPADKTAPRMGDEAFLLHAAGGETTARTLCYCTYHVLANKETVLPRLQDELRSVMPEATSRPDWRSLEKLSWLTAVIKETLRLSAVVTSRLPLVAPNESLVYDHWTIPPGTPVAMSQRDVLHDPAIFRDPLKFDPSRWLPENPELSHLNRYFYPFGRGTRTCAGYITAMAELYVIIAVVFRRFDMELHDTVYERDIQTVRDCFLGEPSLESRGVRIKLSTLAQ